MMMFDDPTDSGDWFDAQPIDPRRGWVRPRQNEPPIPNPQEGDLGPPVELDGQPRRPLTGWEGFGLPPAGYTSTPWTGGPAPTFTNPTITMQDVMNTPGYQFRLDAGQRGQERAASARGTLLTGGTAKALERYRQDYATNEFGNAYNRAQGEAQNTFNNANTAYQTNYGQYLGENARTLSDWLQNLTARRNAETDYWSRLRDVRDPGYNASTQGQA